MTRAAIVRDWKSSLEKEHILPMPFGSAKDHGTYMVLCLFGMDLNAEEDALSHGRSHHSRPRPEDKGCYKQEL